MDTKLLELLRSREGFLSGEEISRRLGVTRSAVWKGMERLREKGYEIHSVTHRGYRLLSVPDLLTPEEISCTLKTKWLGKNIFFSEETDSTNEEAKREALRGSETGSIFVSERQTAGKGRLGRAWQSAAGDGIAFSALLRPEGTPGQITLLTLIAGLAICRAIRKETGCNAELKWPNDIVISGKKVCGILTELGAEAERISFVVIGAGINVNNKEFPTGLQRKATSLFLETEKHFSRAALLRAVLFELEIYCERLFLGETEALLAEYKPLCLSLGRQISVEQKDGILTGKAIGLSPEGELIAEDENRNRFSVQSGEVSVQGIYGVSL